MLLLLLALPTLPYSSFQLQHPSLLPFSRLSLPLNVPQIHLQRSFNFPQFTLKICFIFIQYIGFFYHSHLNLMSCLTFISSHPFQLFILFFFYFLSYFKFFLTSASYQLTYSPRSSSSLLFSSQYLLITRLIFIFSTHFSLLSTPFQLSARNSYLLLVQPYLISLSLLISFNSLFFIFRLTHFSPYQFPSPISLIPLPLVLMCRSRLPASNSRSMLHLWGGNILNTFHSILLRSLALSDFPFLFPSLKSTFCLL